MTLFKDIRLKLADYFQKQRCQKSLQSEEYNKFTDSIINLNQYLLPGEQFAISRSHNDEINFMTFNYTNSLESLLNYSDKPIIIGKKNNSPLDVTIKQIQHIHGTPTERFVMGVDNAEQIENKKFRSSDLLNAIVKPLNNSEGKKLVDTKCKTLIDHAEIICTFGISLGETDTTWWKYIGKNVCDRKIKLIIFWKENDQISNRFQDEVMMKHDEIKTLFLSRTDLNEEQKSTVSNNIFIVLNEERIFSYI